MSNTPSDTEHAISSKQTRLGGSHPPRNAEPQAAARGGRSSEIKDREERTSYSVRCGWSCPLTCVQADRHAVRATRSLFNITEHTHAEEMRLVWCPWSPQAHCALPLAARSSRSSRTSSAARLGRRR